MNDKQDKPPHEKPRPMTDEEVKDFALARYKGEIFTSADILYDQLDSLLPLVFMPIAFMNEEQAAALEADKPVLIYELRSKSGGRSINGYPIFASCSYLYHTDDLTRIDKKIAEIKAAIEGI